MVYYQLDHLGTPIAAHNAKGEAVWTAEYEAWGRIRQETVSDGLKVNIPFRFQAHRNHPLTEAQTKRNQYLSKTRYVVEQSFGTLHRKFRYARAAYFGLIKVSAQSYLKAMCLNLLKAANRLSVLAAT